MHFGKYENSLFLSDFHFQYNLKTQFWRFAVTWTNLVMWWDLTVAALSLTRTLKPPTSEKLSAKWISLPITEPCSVWQVKMNLMERDSEVMTFPTLEASPTVVYKVNITIYLTAIFVDPLFLLLFSLLFSLFLFF